MILIEMDLLQKATALYLLVQLLYIAMHKRHIVDLVFISFLLHTVVAYRWITRLNVVCFIHIQAVWVSACVLYTCVCVWLRFHWEAYKYPNQMKSKVLCKQNGTVNSVWKITKNQDININKIVFYGCRLRVRTYACMCVWACESGYKPRTLNKHASTKWLWWDWWCWLIENWQTFNGADKFTWLSHRAPWKPVHIGGDEIM